MTSYDLDERAAPLEFAAFWTTVLAFDVVFWTSVAKAGRWLALAAIKAVWS